MTSGSLKSQDFVEMTDRIRSISQEAHELTRKTRTGLDSIGEDVRQGNKRTSQVADAAKRAVELAHAEIGTLNAATIEQTRQIEITLQRINELSVDIQKDINKIVMAMQFQDITRQKLEQLHKPALAASAEALSLLSHETRALLQRDLYRAVRAYAERRHQAARRRSRRGAGGPRRHAARQRKGREESRAFLGNCDARHSPVPASWADSTFATENQPKMPRILLRGLAAVSLGCLVLRQRRAPARQQDLSGISA
jgi:hypothetical protein